MKQKNIKKIKIFTVVLFIISFIIINGCTHVLFNNHRTEEQLKATYSAQATVYGIESQLNTYLAKISILKEIIENNYNFDMEEFPILGDIIIDGNDIIDTVELAKDGIVAYAYPITGNENAIGLNLLEHPDRTKYAHLAKESGQYTIAGPFELVQGGMGALLIDPIYINGIVDDEHFWGFSVLVIRWDKFIDSLELDKLDQSSYHYRIWKTDMTTGNAITIAECSNMDFSDSLEVLCSVPNDTWHFDIIPKKGWYSRTQLLVSSILCFLLSVLLAYTYWQFESQQYQAQIYAARIKRSADEARAANTAKTGFLARMSHDIRTPLNGIIGLLNIAEKHPDDVEMLAVNRKKMFVAANHLLSLINDVLQMSKLESTEVVLSKEPIDLNELSSDIITIIEQRAADAGISLEYDDRSDKAKYPYVYGSPLHLRQLFLNIYGNSIKYNHSGGKITSEFNMVGTKDNIVTYQWIISDTGIGMSEEFLKHIFEPFAQEHTDARSVYNGTGLGMAIVKALIDKMNGTIDIRSKLNEGSTFTITIPFEIAPDMHNNNQEEGSDEHPSIKGLKLLVAEDNELNAEIAEALLGEEGAIITLVKDGQQAIDAFSSNPPSTYDAILMDVMMPGIDGLNATRAIRSLDREDAKTIPIIAMTANAFNEDADRCIEAGMNAHLAKPLQMDKVISTIAKYCSHQS